MDTLEICLGFQRGCTNEFFYLNNIILKTGNIFFFCGKRHKIPLRLTYYAVLISSRYKCNFPALTI